MLAPRFGPAAFPSPPDLCTPVRNDYLLVMKNIANDSAIPKSNQTDSGPSRRGASERMLDPVCGVLVQPDSPYHTTHQGDDFAFCGFHCPETFEREPERYLEVNKPAGK